MRSVQANNGALYHNIQGVAEGTSYNIIYRDDAARDFQTEIDSLFASFEKSLSVYDKSSIISRINDNEKDVEIDDFFRQVFIKAKEISRLTDGIFDISAEPLFRAWGFSSQARAIPTDRRLEELKKYIGMDKVWIEGNKLVQSHADVVLNANAIAKGYSTDIIASFLDEKGCADYLVEIGGEIRLRGSNAEGGAWRVGIDRPSEDRLIPGEQMQVVLQMTDRAMATSGNYRQFYIDESGNKITHTINPVTGRPVKHNLLSATVFARDAITADAFATAFMVVGMDKAMDWIEANEELDALFICDEEGDYKVYYTERIEHKIITDEV